jgi:hypothetical protein
LEDTTGDTSKKGQMAKHTDHPEDGGLHKDVEKEHEECLQNCKELATAHILARSLLFYALRIIPSRYELVYTAKNTSMFIFK